MADDVMVATRTVMVRVAGEVHQVWAGQTTAHPDSDVVRDHPDLWRVMSLDFPAPDGDDDGKPTAKDVRAWARENDVDVPARGRIPDEVYAAYEAAQ